MRSRGSCCQRQKDAARSGLFLSAAAVAPAAYGVEARSASMQTCCPKSYGMHVSAFFSCYRNMLSTSLLAAPPSPPACCPTDHSCVPATSCRPATLSACRMCPQCRRMASASLCTCGWTQAASACAWTCLAAWTAQSPYRCARTVLGCGAVLLVCCIIT